jgi:ubiquinone/menaquinone biosynthesis C-methylase UbiE
MERLDPKNTPWIYAGPRRQHLQRYLFAKHHVKGMNVLDAACGIGYGSAMLAETAASVTGIDVDAETVKNAAQAYASSNITFRQADIRSLPFNDHSFDVVVSFETIEHVPLPDAALFIQEIARVLRPGGLLILSTPDRRNFSLDGPPDGFHYFEYNDTDLLSSLSKNFTIEAHCGQEFVQESVLKYWQTCLRIFPTFLVRKIWRAWCFFFHCSGDVHAFDEYPHAIPMVIVVVARSVSTKQKT